MLICALNNGSSKNLRAQAFTHGNDIFFNHGKCAPGSTEGKKLLGHELTHTIQQKGLQRKKVQKSDDDWIKSYKSEKDLYNWEFYQGKGESLDSIIEKFWPNTPDYTKEYVKKITLYENNLKGKETDFSDWNGILIPIPFKEKTNQEAMAKIDKWGDASVTKSLDANTWLANNMIEYLGYARQSPGLSISNGLMSDIMWEGLGNAVAQPFAVMAKKYSEKGTVKLINKGAGKLIGKGVAKLVGGGIGAGIGTAIVPGIGTAIGFIVGTVIEVLFDVFMDMFDGGDAQIAATGASLETAKNAIDQVEKLRANTKNQMNLTEKLKQDFKSRINLLGGNQEAIQSITNYLDGEISYMNDNEIDVTDRSLFKELLKNWVLENAGDDNDPYTSEIKADWQNAVKYLKQNVDDFDYISDKDSYDLDWHPEIWVYQLKKDFSRFGFKPTAFERFDTMKNVDYMSNPDQVHEKYSDKVTWTVRSSDLDSREKFIEYANHTGAGLTQSEITAIRNGHNFSFQVYVDEFNYKLMYDSPVTRRSGNRTYKHSQRTWYENAD